MSYSADEIWSMGHDSCEAHCDTCGVCIPVPDLADCFDCGGTVEGLMERIDHSGPMSDVDAVLAQYEAYVQPTHGMLMLSVVSGDIVRRPHWDADCSLMVTSTGDGWFLAIHYRLRPGTNDWVPVHASRRVWPQDSEWVAA